MVNMIDPRWSPLYPRDASPPRGKVAIVFTDIVGSTTLWEASPDTMDEAMDVHNETVRRIILAHGGYEVKTIGDSFMVAFDSPASAVQFAGGTQLALLQAPWPDDASLGDVHDKWLPQYADDGVLVFGGICVRIGISYGSCKDEYNPLTGRFDYRGGAVNLAARLEGSAPHGATSVSEECYAAAREEDCVAEIAFSPPKAVELKGIGTVNMYLATPVALAARAAYYYRSTTGLRTKGSPQ
eukprot:gene4798-16081_t